MAHSHSETPSTNTPISLRVPKRQLDLIDRAARFLGKNRTEFLLDTAYRKAQTILLDQTTFYLDDTAWENFTATLDARPEDNPKLRALLSRKPLWER